MTCEYQKPWFESHEDLYKNILINYIGHLTPNSVKPLYLIIEKPNGCIKERNGGKYLTLVPTDESRDFMENQKSSENYDEKEMKIKSNPDNDLPLKKTLKLDRIVV